MNQELNTTGTQAAPPMGIAALAPIIMQMLTTRAGGLAGLVKMFTDKGLGEIASSWVNKGPNLPITGEQVRSALGDDLIGQIAAKGGIAPDNMVSQIAALLPGLVDELTPDGVIPEESVMHKAVDFLKSKLM